MFSVRRTSSETSSEIVDVEHSAVLDIECGDLRKNRRAFPRDDAWCEKRRQIDRNQKTRGK